MITIRKIVFIYLTPISGEYQITDDMGYNVQRRPQLGFQYLCAVLERINVKTDIFDQSVSFFNLDWLLKKIEEYDAVGFYCSDCQEEKVKFYCQKIKDKYQVPILVGGPSTLGNSTFLDFGCDFVVHGEGEMTIQQIVEYYNGERKIEDVKGVSYKKDDKIIEAPPQELIEDLDQLPFPDRSKVDINSYYDYLLFGMRTPYITMIASRGCLHRCSYCTSCKIWRYQYRRRSADNVLLEIDEMIEKYNIKFISFQDDIFGGTNNWIEEFCNKLISQPYKIRWMVIIHPFSIRKDTERILRLMKRAGCNTLSFGIQSAHPEILKNILRHPDEPEQLKKIIKIANRLGFVTAASYIFGLPGDTRETIQTTIDYSLNCGSLLANYYNLSVLRGSEIAIKYKDKKICELPEEEIIKLAVTASKKFYSRPAALFKIGYFIMKNPRWLGRVLIKGLPSVLAKIGFMRAKNKY